MITRKKIWQTIKELRKDQQRYFDGFERYKSVEDGYYDPDSDEEAEITYCAGMFTAYDHAIQKLEELL